jgi:cyclopropane fatty-acyl-phospholipid synthase-like methyltransferase
MAGRGRKILERMYAGAQTAEELPWHEAEPPELLVEALDQRAQPGAALDIGCGAGTYSIYMAQRGYQVTALDFMPQAVAMLQQKITNLKLNIDVMRADIGAWETAKQFDVVLDIGCLHTPGTIEYLHYKQCVLNWLAPDGDFILLHFGRRGWWDCWPIGPTRKFKNELVELFQPELELVEYRPRHLDDMPLIVGRSAEVGRYWFRRKSVQ